VHFPIACWTLATIGDVAGIWLGRSVWQLSGLLLAAGTLFAIAAMISGMIDLVKIDEQNEGAQIADIHMQLVFVTWTLYAVSLFMRVEKFRLTTPGFIAITLSCIGFAFLSAAGWFGGKLVYRYGIGQYGMDTKKNTDAAGAP